MSLQSAISVYDNLSVYDHRRIQDFVRGGQGPLGPRGAKALLVPLDPRLTIWGSNFFCGGGGGGKAPLAPLDPRLMTTLYIPVSLDSNG